MSGKNKLFAGSVKSGWPLGINESMDDHAAARGLSHWSCTSSSSNRWWIRKDGYPYQPNFKMPDGYPDELRKIDREVSMKESVFKDAVKPRRHAR